MNTISQNASRELDSRAHEYMRRHNCDYRTAFFKVAKADQVLSRRYSHGVSVSKAYADTLTAAQRGLAELQADPSRAKTLAGFVEDKLARPLLVNVGAGVADPLERYRQALALVREQYPSLERCARDGFVADGDYQLVGLLIPALQGEIEKDGFKSSWTVDKTTDLTRCQCGKNRNYCRGKKLASERGVDEDNVAAFSKCILDARLHGDELDKIYCYFR